MPLRLPQARSYRDTILADRPVGYWRLGYRSGLDESGRGNNGVWKGTTVQGAAGALPNDSDPGARFVSGAQQGYLQIAPVDPVSLTAPFTVEGWAYFIAIAGNTNDLFGSRGTSDNSLDIKFSGTVVHGDIGTGSAWLATNADVSITISNRVWYHVVYAIAATGYTIYVNGLQKATGSLGGTALCWNSTHTPCIGTAGVNNTGEGMDGLIDEVAIYDYALSAQQVLMHYAARSVPGFMTPIYLPQRGPAGAIAYAYTSN